MSMPDANLFVFVYRRGPGWIAGRSVNEQPLRGHVDYLGQLFAQGRVLFGGPFLDEESGGLTVVRAANQNEAEALLASDPALRDGIFEATVRPWLAAFGM
jgi:uncharacterized protein